MLLQFGGELVDPLWGQISENAIAATLQELPPCLLTVTYVPPEDSWDAVAEPLGAAFQAQVRALGEPWLSLLTRVQLATVLAGAGFTLIEDLGASDVQHRYGLPAVHHERLAIARKEQGTEDSAREPRLSVHVSTPAPASRSRSSPSAI